MAEVSISKILTEPTRLNLKKISISMCDILNDIIYIVTFCSLGPEENAHFVMFRSKLTNSNIFLTGFSPKLKSSNDKSESL